MAKTTPKTKVDNTVNENITNIDLSVIRKKRFTINGDSSKVLELNTSDLNILARLKEAYPKLIDLANNAFKDLPDTLDVTEDYNFAEDEATSEVIQKLKEADTNMRELVDYIFNSNVSELCASDGSMYDPISGKFRFEYIIETLVTLYETDVSKELNSLSTRVRKHTDKYTNKYIK